MKTIFNIMDDLNDYVNNPDMNLVEKIGSLSAFAEICQIKIEGLEENSPEVNDDNELAKYSDSVGFIKDGILKQLKFK